MKKDDDKLEAAYCAAYMDFLAKGKTERRFYAAAIELLTKAGFKELSTLKTLKPGDRVFRNWMNKSVVMFIVGRQPLADGMQILGAHIDSPRIDLKQNSPRQGWFWR